MTANNRVEFLFDGDSYQDQYLEIIEKAKVSIILQTYIFEFDTFGKRVYHELISAAKRGVLVYLLVDDFGTSHLTSYQIREMSTNGVFFSRFNKLSLSNILKWGRRLHHKVLIIDGLTSIVGGINVINFSNKKYLVPRLDFAVLLVGDAVKSLSEYCFRLLNVDTSISSRAKGSKIHYGETKIKINVNDWTLHREDIFNKYINLIAKSKKEITIINSYFFPGQKFLNKLYSAVERGVKVKIIIPSYSDWQSLVYASEYTITDLLNNGIEVYRWEKSLLHGKLAIFDREYAMIGSFNLHYTSFKGNLEINIDILSKKYLEKLSNDIDLEVVNNCHKVLPDEILSDESHLVSFKRFFFYTFFLMISKISIFLIKRKNKKETRNV